MKRTELILLTLLRLMTGCARVGGCKIWGAFFMELSGPRFKAT